MLGTIASARAVWEAEQNPRPLALSRLDLQGCAHQLRALAHELQAKVAARTRGEAHDVETAPVVGHGQGFALEADDDLGGGSVLAHVLECFLNDSQDRCLRLRR